MELTQGAALRTEIPRRERMIWVTTHFKNGVAINGDERSTAGDTDSAEASLGFDHELDTTVMFVNPAICTQRNNKPQESP